MIQIGGQYQVFGSHVIVVAWDSGDGSIWLMLHAVATDVPIYRVCPNGDLECWVRANHAGYHCGRRCDGTVADVLPWSGETGGATG